MVWRKPSWLVSTISHPSRSPVRKKPTRAGRSDGLLDLVAGPRGLRDDGDRQRPAAHGDDLEQTPRVVREAIESLRDHLSEGDRAEGRALVAQREVHVVTHELFDEKRTSPRLARGRTRRSLRELVGAVEERQGQPPRVRRGERTHGDVARLGAIGPAIAASARETGSPPPPRRGGSSRRGRAARPAGAPARGEARRCRRRPTGRRRCR